MAISVLNIALALAEVVQGVLFWELRAVTSAGVQQSFGGWWLKSWRLSECWRTMLLKQNTSKATCASIDCSTWKDYLKASEIVFWQTIKCVEKKHGAVTGTVVWKMFLVGEGFTAGINQNVFWAKLLKRMTRDESCVFEACDHCGKFVSKTMNELKGNDQVWIISFQYQPLKRLVFKDCLIKFNCNHFGGKDK